MQLILSGSAHLSLVCDAAAAAAAADVCAHLVIENRTTHGNQDDGEQGEEEMILETR